MTHEGRREVEYLERRSGTDRRTRPERRSNWTGAVTSLYDAPLRRDLGAFVDGLEGERFRGNDRCDVTDYSVPDVTLARWIETVRARLTR
jgi:hypothetical protein